MEVPAASPNTYRIQERVKLWNLRDIMPALSLARDSAAVGEMAKDRNTYNKLIESSRYPIIAKTLTDAIDRLLARSSTLPNAMDTEYFRAVFINAIMKDQTVENAALAMDYAVWKQTQHTALNPRTGMEQHTTNPDLFFFLTSTKREIEDMTDGGQVEEPKIRPKLRSDQL